MNETKTAAEAPYVKRRVQDQEVWHANKATWNKQRYYASEVATMLAGALIPIVNVWVADDAWTVRVLSAILGSVVLISAGLAKLFKFQENWLQYRAIAESLGREREMYSGKVGDYAVAAENAEALLIERVEGLLASTTSQFIATHRAPSSEARSSEPVGR
jgi:hypothetical protein